LATRNFERSFPLNENVEIVAATVANGILCITLEQKIPETQKAKKVAITFSK
jgi:HSP20 family molecular chaperone IbpA